MADFGSESVAAFRRNGWPTCVGISGRLGLEYAIWDGYDVRSHVPAALCPMWRSWNGSNVGRCIPISP